jgi:hypothetical protein
MVDVDGLASFHPRAGLAVRAQTGQAHLAGEAHIRTGVTEGDDLVEQGGGPQVRVIDEAGLDVAAVPGQGVGGRATGTWYTLAGQVGAHRLAVTPEMAGDGRNGPPPFGQSICFHVFSY